MHIGQADPTIYAEQLAKKETLTKEEFAPFYCGEIDVYASPASHFRMRAEFKIWHEDGTASFAMFEPGEYKKPFKITDFSIGAEAITSRMPPLIEAVNQSETLRRKLFQVEFLTSLNGECLITLIYHKPLDDQWEGEARELQNSLNCRIIGRSRKQKVVLADDFITETMNLNNGVYTYQQVETGFTQPNAHVCAAMLNWAVEQTKDSSGDLLELYCGNGNFTLPLSKNFTKVLATEVSKTSVNSALYNIQQNNISNIHVARLSSEEFTQAQNKVREFRRLKDTPLDDYNFSTVFVDPPRAGLDQDTCSMISQFDTILYISCNPATLKQNLETLCSTHTVERLALFDQFPYTEHRECGALLRKK